MQLGSFIGVLSAIVGVAFVTAFVSSTNTAGILKALFDGFAGSIRASLGKSN